MRVLSVAQSASSNSYHENLYFPFEALFCCFSIETSKLLERAFNRCDTFVDVHTESLLKLQVLSICSTIERDGLTLRIKATTRTEDAV